MQRTIERIVQAGSLPLSIVIVGVGDADFSKMVCWHPVCLLCTCTCTCICDTVHVCVTVYICVCIHVRVLCICLYIMTQDTLDADDTPLKDKYGKQMERDIVQFVPFRQFQSRSGANFSLVSTSQMCQICQCTLFLIYTCTCTCLKNFLATVIILDHLYYPLPTHSMWEGYCSRRVS